MSHADGERTELLELNKKVDQIKDKTTENVKKIKQREYNLGILSDEVDHVEQNAKDFKKSAENVNRAECCKTYKEYL
ncbi:uncharacterized protein LOC135333587 isoform X2 [Halichondria panicea]|uniref:uncharacterized protein LOC135333587 isoform X2 n=1 Tax=Halichondria panicea TaxID=6063 RepID=UPI00312B82E3